MKTPEGKVKDEIRDYLTRIGAYHFWPVQMGYGAATVDCLGCYMGHFFAVEVKRPGVTEPTARQRNTLNTVHDAGGMTGVVTSVAQVEELFFVRLGFTPQPPKIGVPLRKFQSGQEIK